MIFTLLQNLLQEWWNWNTENLCNTPKWKSSDVNTSNLKQEPTPNPCHTYILSMSNAWKEWDCSVAMMKLELPLSFLLDSLIFMQPLQWTNHAVEGEDKGEIGSKGCKKKSSSDVFVTILEKNKTKSTVS